MATAPSIQKNREAWLTKCGQALRPVFARVGHPLPINVKFTCGFPSRRALASKHRAIGECWDSRVSRAKVFEIMLTPLVADDLETAVSVAHELVHATVGLDKGHRREFAKLARAIGLESPMTQTPPGPTFKAWFAQARKKLGRYPHKELLASNAPKKQKGRQLKVYCAACERKGEPYIVRMAAATYERGAPVCPFHKRSMRLEG